ncbi:hypothetical protein F3087_02655 [Nocardia colli]|uniref:DoxX family protein n=1 Tax=Nocardia colli TaxID=2545717 RepID=A0A5N0ELF2_9NOCA|nr:hypothetical protein [Nocardia colli]KAA8890227.1 hypothetical protein F3087_02655 [Nocardia colli]
MGNAGDIGGVSGAASVLTMRFSMPGSNSIALSSVSTGGSWTPLRKLGFRFLFTVGGSVLVVFVYGGFVVLNALIMPLKTGLAQVGSVLLRGREVAMDATNSGDTLGDWYALAGCFFVAIVATVAWTALDRRRDNYRSLGRSLFEVARVGLVVDLIAYGLAKAIPIQMGYMTQPAHQLPLVGDLGLKDTLWTFMGASDMYSIATGLAEITAGVLLLSKRTWLAGGLLAIVAMAQVFLLNLCYDVPVKILSGTLVATAIAITAPYWPNVARVLTNSVPLAPRKLWPAPGSKSVRVGATSLGFVTVAAHSTLIAVVALLAIHNMHSPRSALDGEWTALSFTVDGVPATMTGLEPGPWANVAVTDRADYTSFVSQTPAGATTVWALDLQEGSLLIRRRLSDQPTTIRFQLDGDHTLLLSGTVGNHDIEGRYRRRIMQRADSPFRLVQPGPDADLPATS